MGKPQQRSKLAILILVYICLLLASALPLNAIQDVLSQVSKTSKTVLYRFAIIPGLDLFKRNKAEAFKVRGNCIRIKGFTSDNQSVELYASPLGCQTGSHLALTTDIFEIMIYRFIEEPNILRHRAARLPGGVTGSEGSQLMEKHLSFFKAMGDYFCHSSKVDRKGLDFSHVIVAWQQRQINYLSGELRANFYLVSKWSCPAHLLFGPFWDPRQDDPLLQEFVGS